MSIWNVSSFIVKHKDEHNLKSLIANERYFYNPRAMNVRFRIKNNILFVNNQVQFS